MKAEARDAAGAPGYARSNSHENSVLQTVLGKRE